MRILRDINNGIADAITNIPVFAVPLALLSRIMLAAIFVMAGSSKIGGFAATQGYMQAMGVPGFLLPFVIALEIGGGLALIVGFQTRLAAFGLAVFSVAAAFLFHHGADQVNQIMFMKNIAMAGGLLALTLNGAGRCSLDGEKTS
jgi:putative oxidoreductase